MDQFFFVSIWDLGVIHSLNIRTSCELDTRQPLHERGVESYLSSFKHTKMFLEVKLDLFLFSCLLCVFPKCSFFFFFGSGPPLSSLVLRFCKILGPTFVFFFFFLLLFFFFIGNLFKVNLKKKKIA